MEKIITFKSIRRILFTAIFLFAIIACLFADSSLKSLLINLEGWEADEAEAVTVNVLGTETITVSRSYSQGNKELEVSIIGGSSMAGLQGMTGITSDISVEDSETSERVLKVDGFQVVVDDDKTSKSGEIVVSLTEKGKSGAAFSVEYDGISEEEAMSIAKKFDWKKIKSEIEK